MEGIFKHNIHRPLNLLMYVQSYSIVHSTWQVLKQLRTLDGHHCAYQWIGMKWSVTKARGC